QPSGSGVAPTACGANCPGTTKRLAGLRLAAWNVARVDPGGWPSPTTTTATTASPATPSVEPAVQPTPRGQPHRPHHTPTRSSAPERPLPPTARPTARAGPAPPRRGAGTVAILPDSRQAVAWFALARRVDDGGG